jgi:vitamin B12 transporter
MKKLVWLVGISVLLLQLHGSTVHAQEPHTAQETGQGTAGQNTTITQSPSSPVQSQQPLKMPEVIVTATKTEESTTHTTVATDVITWEEIQERQQTDVLQILRDVPGMTIVQTGARGGGTSLFTRGGEPDYNLVLIDGVKVNNAGGFYDFSDLTNTGIERIEIVRGPQSALYGSDAMSSVIQVFTPRGEGPPQGTFRFRGGSYTTFEEQGKLAGGTKTYGYSLAFGRIDTDGFLPINNSYSNTTIASRFDWDGIRDLQLSTTLRYVDGRFHFPTEAAGDRFDVLDPQQYQDRRSLVIGPRAIYQTTPWWKQTLQLGYFEQWGTYRDPFNEPPDFGSFVSNNDEY